MRATAEQHVWGLFYLDKLFGYSGQADFWAWEDTKWAAFPNGERQRRRQKNRVARAARRKNRV